MLATDIETHARVVNYRPIVVYSPRIVTIGHHTSWILLEVNASHNSRPGE